MGNTNNIVLARANTNDTSEWPLGGHQTIFTNEDYIPNSDVPGVLMPLVDLVQAGQVLRRPTFPKMPQKTLTEVPSTEQRE